MRSSMLSVTSVLFLSVSFTHVHATIISSSCVDEVYTSLDGLYPYEEVIGQNCATTETFDLSGGALIKSSDGIPAGDALAITGSLTFETWSYENYFDGIYLNGSTSTLSVVDASLGSYSMDQTFSFDNGALVDSVFNESLDGNGLVLLGQTAWDVYVFDGYASLVTLDGDGDGIAGINLSFMTATSLDSIVEIQLTSVPVPAALWLFLSGFLGLLPLIKKRSVK